MYRKKRAGEYLLHGELVAPSSPGDRVKVWTPFNRPIGIPPTQVALFRLELSDLD